MILLYFFYIGLGGAGPILIPNFVLFYFFTSFSQNASFGGGHVVCLEQIAKWLPLLELNNFHC